MHLVTNEGESPPHDAIAEQAVLASYMAMPTLRSKIREVLAVDDLYVEINRILYEVLLDLDGNADLVGLVGALDDRGLTKRVGGVSAVSSLLDSEGADSAAVHHARRICRLAAQRRALEAIQRAADGWLAEDVAAAQEALAQVSTSGSSRSTLDELWNPVGIEVLTIQPPARKWLLRAPPEEGGFGVVARGKTGFFAAEGGVGKTKALLQLAISLATGKPWFGHFTVTGEARLGQVLLLLAEEDRDEVWRRIWVVAEALKLTPEERQVCAKNIYALGLAGMPVALTALDHDSIMETPLANEIRYRLKRDAGKHGWSLVVLDPLSRFAGGGVETSNEASTRYVQLLESLTEAPGNPTVLTAAHSSKIARRQEQVDLRGVTGLSDAARLVITLLKNGDDVSFDVAKSNYSLPISTLRLKWVDEVLWATAPSDRKTEELREEAERSAAIDEDVARVVKALGRDGPLTTKSAVAASAGMKAERARNALDIAIARGAVLNLGSKKYPSYTLPTLSGPTNGGGETPLIPPGPDGPDGESVRPSSPSGPGTARDRTDRTRKNDREDS